MTGFERRWALAVLEGFAPPDGPGLAPRAGEAGYLEALRRMGDASDGKSRLGLRLGVWIAALSPLWMLGRLRTMAGVPLAERPAILGRLLVHRAFAVRELTLLLKIAASLALLGAAPIRERSGYDLPPPPARLPLAAGGGR